jgi:hypothetical protein
MKLLTQQTHRHEGNCHRHPASGPASGTVGRPGNDDADACSRDPGHRHREPLADRHQLDRSGRPDAEADSAVPDATAAVRKHAAEHAGAGSLHLGLGHRHDEPAAQCDRYAELLQDQPGEHRRVPRQVPGRVLLPRLALLQQGGCTDAEWAAIKENQRFGSEAQKRANDALFRGLDKQQAALEADARTLQRLQGSAQSATGQMQAISYANQLASQQANQLLQIRGLLIAQQNALATRMQVEADREAQQAAAHAASTESRINTTSSPKNWLELNR